MRFRRGHELRSARLSACADEAITRCRGLSRTADTTPGVAVFTTSEGSSHLARGEIVSFSRPRRRSLSTALLGLLTSIAMLSPGFTPTAIALDNGVALTPPMGWNSWNRYACDGLNESVVRAQADAMVSSGMKAAGYQFVNLDDCWQSSRAADGTIVADSSKFPSGIKAIADYVHSKGLKFGLYTDRGTATCAGRPGSQGHEVQDANTYASWGVDYVKEDNCNATLDKRTQYVAMRDALAGSGRGIVFSICGWDFDGFNPTTGNLWRTTGDINDSWGSVTSILDDNNTTAMYAHPGAWNDPDMLMVGNYGTGAIGGGGMTDTEYRSHFGMWAMSSAPLIAGNDLTNINATTKTTLTNTEIIAVDQDPLGFQGTMVRSSGGLEVWVKKVQGSGVRVVALLNRSSAAASIAANWSDLGIGSGSATVRDLWAHVDRGSFSGSYATSVPSHGTAVLRVVGSETPDRIHIVKTDTRVITNMRVTTEFLINDQLHYDWEDTGTLDHTTALGVDGWGSTWNATTQRFESNMLTTQSNVAGAAVIDINKVDTRTVPGVRVSLDFQIGGLPHHASYNVSPFSSTKNLVLDANGGSWNGTTFVGNFLHP